MHTVVLHPDFSSASSAYLEEDAQRVEQVGDPGCRCFETALEARVLSLLKPRFVIFLTIGLLRGVWGRLGFRV